MAANSGINPNISWYTRVQWNNIGLEKLRTREVKALLYMAAIQMGKRWRRQHLPRHFTEEGYKEFRYSPRSGQGSRRGQNAKRRSGQYQRRKLREKGHQLPLVWSGELRRLAVYGERAVRVTGTSKTVTARMPMPRKANWKHPRSPVHPIAELQSTSTRVLTDLKRFVVQETERQLATVETKK